MQVVSAKKYIELQTAKWEKDREEFWKAVKRGERHYTEAPCLAFYLFSPQRKYGYVAFDGKKALWDKTKKGVIAFWEDEERKRKIRGW